MSKSLTVLSCPAGKIGGKIRLVTLRAILDTRSKFHTFRQEFERANRNAAFCNHCNSEDRKCEPHVRSFTILASVCTVASIMPNNALIAFRESAKNSAQCYQTDFSSNFSGWARDY